MTKRGGFISPYTGGRGGRGAVPPMGAKPKPPRPEPGHVDGRKVQLPSGAELIIQLPPMHVSDELAMAIGVTLLPARMDGSQEMDVNLVKDVILLALSSREIRAALEPCLAHCLYNGEKIAEDTFQSPAAREDYWVVLGEVAYDNVLPFLKGLSLRFKGELEAVKRFLKSMSATPGASSGAASSAPATPTASTQQSV